MPVLFLQLAIILAAARLCGALFRRFGQPRVCGEIAAGLALGPSLLGGIFPATHALIFPVGAAPIFRALSEIGLALLMFFVGLELDVDEIRVRKRAAFAISLAGIVVPFGLGVVLGEVLHRLLVLDIQPVGFRLFVGIAVSITAIPTLTRILDDLNLQHTRIAALTTTAAALDDVVGWTILAAVIAFVRAEFNWADAVMRLAVALVFALAMVRVVRGAVRRWCAHVDDPAVFSRGGVLTAALLTLLLSASVTSAIGLSGIFGAFLAGITFGVDTRLRDALASRLHPITLTLFLPVFFTYTGLRADIGSVEGSLSWILCGVVIAVAIAGKVGGCTAAAATQGLSRSDAWSIGILMNTRGLMELVVVNIGFDLGVIPRSVFFMLVLMAVVTTYMTTPLVRHVLRHSEFKPLLSAPYAGRPWRAAARQVGAG